MVKKNHISYDGDAWQNENTSNMMVMHGKMKIQVI
jgi:hypothetical protein